MGHRLGKPQPSGYEDLSLSWALARVAVERDFECRLGLCLLDTVFGTEMPGHAARGSNSGMESNPRYAGHRCFMNQNGAVLSGIYKVLGWHGISREAV